LNAANEIAVEAFLAEQVGFMDIPNVIESVLSASMIEEAYSIEQLVAVDAAARQAAKLWLKKSGLNKSGLKSHG